MLNHSSVSGNALFLILIAVALFAALSYAVTQSSRSGTNVMDDEQAELIASTILDYGAQVRLAVNRVRTVNGCRKTEVSFWTEHTKRQAEWSGWADNFYLNSNSPDDKRCHIFDPNGGNLNSPYTLPGISKITDETNSVYHIYQYVERGNIEGHGTDMTVGDVFMYVGRVKEPICRAFNRLALNLDDTPSDTFYVNHTVSVDGTPHTHPGDSASLLGDEDTPEFFGEWEGCVHHIGNDTYKIWMLLWTN